uniref:Phosphatidylinositol-specific phospholipase C X domain-containing protein n=1 Tax=Leersia perrieri TaxID=77586 RepID=A0A0D9XG27_9ORYZ
MSSSKSNTDDSGNKKTKPLEAMGAFFSSQVNRRKLVTTEKHALATRLSAAGENFPGSDHHPTDRKNWMAELGPDKVRINQVVWPGTHDSATDRIGIPFVTRPFAQCQSMSVYDQLAVAGARAVDVRVQEDRRVCHGVLASYSVDVVLADVKRFLAETVSEVIILEPRKSPAPKPGELLWSAGYLRDNWIDTDLPETKFESNIKFLGEQPPVSQRKFFYRVENTVTPQADNPVLCVKPVTRRIHGFARLFIAEVFAKGLGDRLQVFSTDFIDGDFVDACAGVTKARVDGAA